MGDGGWRYQYNFNFLHPMISIHNKKGLVIPARTRYGKRFVTSCARRDLCHFLLQCVDEPEPKVGAISFSPGQIRTYFRVLGTCSVSERVFLREH